MDDQLDMIEIIASFGQFGWESGSWNTTTEAVDVWGSSADQLRFNQGTERYLGAVEREGLYSYLQRQNANMSTQSFQNDVAWHRELDADKTMVFNFAYEDDWETRYWQVRARSCGVRAYRPSSTNPAVRTNTQYLNMPGDRRTAPINFKDQLTYERTILPSERSMLSVQQHVPWKELDRNCFIKGEVRFAIYFGLLGGCAGLNGRSLFPPPPPHLSPTSHSLTHSLTHLLFL